MNLDNYDCYNLHELSYVGELNGDDSQDIAALG